MKKCGLPLIAVLTLSLAGHAQDQAKSNYELFRELRRDPGSAIQLDGRHVQVVNDRYEACLLKKEARYLMISEPIADGYDVKVVSPGGAVLMEGHSRDVRCTVPDGAFRYYDANGTLRAEGHYFNGNKTDTWHRFDANGTAMTDKEYDGLDWEARQVKLGLASRSRTLDALATE
jgi:hypothetical protein